MYILYIIQIQDVYDVFSDPVDTQPSIYLRISWNIYVFLRIFIYVITLHM